MTMDELKEVAKSLGIKGISSMKKAELEEAIKAASPGPVEPVEEKAEKPVDSIGSSPVKSAFELHPKFAKFKSQGD